MPNCINWYVHVLVAIFGTGSWLAINAIFSELSFLVQTAPESWNLASGLVLTIQLGNILPFIYVFSSKVWPPKSNNSDRVIIYVILAIGCISSILLAFLWSYTLDFLGESHSFYLYLFTFTLAAVDCTSSITYFPYMDRYPEQYIVSLMIGEGLSGLIPSVLALAQNGGTVKMESAESITSTKGPYLQSFMSSSDYSNFTFSSTQIPNSTTSYCFTLTNFSEEVYFLVIFVLFALSGLAFFVLNCLSISKKSSSIRSSRSSSHNNSNRASSVHGAQNGFGLDGETSSNSSETVEHLKLLTTNESQTRSTLSPTEWSPQSVMNSSPNNEIKVSIVGNENDGRGAMTTASSGITTTYEVTNSRTSLLNYLSRNDITLFTSIFIVCFLFNGALPSISTYILLPYGNEVMLVVSNIGNIANPLTCIMMIFLPLVTAVSLSSFTTFLTLSVSIVLTLFALLSPPLTHHFSGVLITGFLWVLFKVVATVARVVQANHCRSRGKHFLFLYGAVMQLGSFCGALIFYFLCNYTTIFKPVFADC